MMSLIRIQIKKKQIIWTKMWYRDKVRGQSWKFRWKWQVSIDEAVDMNVDLQIFVSLKKCYVVNIWKTGESWVTSGCDQSKKGGWFLQRCPWIQWINMHSAGVLLYAWLQNSRILFDQDTYELCLNIQRKWFEVNSNHIPAMAVSNFVLVWTNIT